MKRKNLALSALLALAGGLALAGAPASAQFFPRPHFYGGYYSGEIVIPAPRRPVGMPIAEIFEELEARGYHPQGVVGRRRDVVIVNALDPRRQPVRLIVDAFDGEILERFARGSAAAPLPETRRQESLKSPEPGKPAEEAIRPPEPAPRRSLADSTPAPQRPAPVAPARPPSEWLPKDLVPAAPQQ